MVGRHRPGRDRWGGVGVAQRKLPGGGGGSGHRRLPGHGRELAAEVVAGDRLGPGPDGGDINRGAAGGPGGEVGAVEAHDGVDRAQRIHDADAEGVAEAGEVGGEGEHDLPGGQGVGLRGEEDGLAAGVRVAVGRARAGRAGRGGGRGVECGGHGRWPFGR